MYNKLVRVAAERLKADDLRLSLAKLKDWTLLEHDTKIEKEFKFHTFEDTWAFLNQVSMRSHLYGHHPEIRTVYNKVKITLETHDVQGISDIDIKLAKRIDKYRENYKES